MKLEGGSDIEEWELKKLNPWNTGDGIFYARINRRLRLANSAAARENGLRRRHRASNSAIQTGKLSALTRVAQQRKSARAR